MRGQRSLAVAAAAAAALAGRYVVGRSKADMQTVAELDTRLSDLGEVERLSILPVVDRHTEGAGLLGEPGVSYLIEAIGSLWPKAAFLLPCSLHHYYETRGVLLQDQLSFRAVTVLPTVAAADALFAVWHFHHPDVP